MGHQSGINPTKAKTSIHTPTLSSIITEIGKFIYTESIAGLLLTWNINIGSPFGGAEWLKVSRHLRRNDL